MVDHEKSGFGERVGAESPPLGMGSTGKLNEVQEGSRPVEPVIVGAENDDFSDLAVDGGE